MADVCVQLAALSELGVVVLSCSSVKGESGIKGV